MADTTTEKIIQALADYLKRDAATIQAAHHLRDDLGLDSMAIIELLYKIEETFELQIPDQDLPAMTTVGSVAAYVQRRLAPAASPQPTAPATRPASRTKAPAAAPKKSSAKAAKTAPPKKAKKTPARTVKPSSRTTKPKRKA